MFLMDLITGLPEDNGFSTILVVVDKQTKYAHFLPCKHNINEEETAKLIHDNIWCHYGLPMQIISDRDARWTGAFWEYLTSLIGIQQLLTTAYHPQADGQTEVMNQILEIALRAYCSDKKNKWCDSLPGFALSYNSTEHTATKFPPAYLLRGFHPKKIGDFLSQYAHVNKQIAVESRTAKEFQERMMSI